MSSSHVLLHHRTEAFSLPSKGILKAFQRPLKGLSERLKRPLKGLILKVTGYQCGSDFRAVVLGNMLACCRNILKCTAHWSAAWSREQLAE
jgi:hypothetical protein